MLEVDGQSFLTIVVVAAVAATCAGLMAGRLPVPVVVLEVVLGIVVGPQLLGLAEPDRFVDFFASLGLGMLFFFAGYEIDFGRLKGEPLKLALLAGPCPWSWPSPSAGCWPGPGWSCRWR